MCFAILSRIRIGGNTFLEACTGLQTGYHTEIRNESVFSSSARAQGDVSVLGATNYNSVGQQLEHKKGRLQRCTACDERRIEPSADRRGTIQREVIRM